MFGILAVVVIVAVGMTRDDGILEEGDLSYRGGGSTRPTIVRSERQAIGWREHDLGLSSVIVVVAATTGFEQFGQFGGTLGQKGFSGSGSGSGIAKTHGDTIPSLGLQSFPFHIGKCRRVE